MDPGIVDWSDPGGVACQREPVEYRDRAGYVSRISLQAAHPPDARGQQTLRSLAPPSETPTAPRTSKPRPVKFSPLGTERPMSS
jgi:hypothetical protein